MLDTHSDFCEYPENCCEPLKIRFFRQHRKFCYHGERPEREILRKEWLSVLHVPRGKCIRQPLEDLQLRSGGLDIDLHDRGVAYTRGVAVSVAARGDYFAVVSTRAATRQKNPNRLYERRGLVEGLVNIRSQH